MPAGITLSAKVPRLLLVQLASRQGKHLR
jgi:hypothetical protein